MAFQSVGIVGDIKYLLFARKEDSESLPPNLRGYNLSEKP
jgi:hypothetical protein